MTTMTTRRRWEAGLLALIAAWALIVLPLAARAEETGNAEIDAAIAQYDDLEYEKAAAALEKALANPELSKQERTEGYRVLALSYVALGKDDAARAAFKKLLEADPTYRLSRTENPHAIDIFDEVKAAMPVPVAATGVQVTAAVSPTHPKPGETLSLTISLGGDGAQTVTTVTVHHRVRGAGDYSTVTAEKGDGAWTATIPGTFVTAPAIEYWVEADGGADPAAAVMLGSQGTADAPLAVLVGASSHAKPIFAKWWFWAGIGAVGTGVAAALLLGGGGAKSGDTTVTITVNQ